MPSGLSRRQLARVLESVADFPSPDIDLEQYLTPTELAAHLSHLAAVHGDLTGATVLDLGTGTGMLALAAGQYAPDRVVGVDVDAAALVQARRNQGRVDEVAREVGATSIVGPSSGYEWFRADVSRLPFERERLSAPVTVLSNPPFGAQRGNRHADRSFLEAAADLADVSYTIHNEGSQEFVESFAADEGGTVTHAFEAEFPIDHRFAFHDRERAMLEAEVFRVEWRERESRS
ncbi:METTL5 family protein [Natronosalvus halobius]|uniref:METTL5 family protein n=1 Tax=Natronosalvus halobius TaxID=2953746 RepID=UPI00209D1126|nr:METTL5 family protein [Natronosalvus halobius]USZ72892.1 METTL5 family protein [Natronosalvus halobius]